MPDPRSVVIYALLAILSLLGIYTLSLQGELHLSEMERKNEALVFERERVRAAEVLAKRQGEYRQTETNLTAALAIERNQSDEARAHHARRVDVLLGRLRDAQARADAANVPRTPTSAATRQTPDGGDGPLIPRPIGEEDVLEAGRGDDIRTALLGCYRAYDRARTEIEAINLRSTIE